MSTLSRFGKYDEVNGGSATADRGQLHKRVSAVAWGTLLVWIGIGTLAHVGWGVGLVGIAVIFFAAQLARRYVVGLPFDVFTIAIGVVFALGGVSELFSLHIDLIPVLVLAAGVAIILSALTTKRIQ